MADDKTLSETIIERSDALRSWEAMQPFVDEVKSLVEEYSEVIDGIGQFFSVVGFVWGIYSDMEKAKENAAQQKAMVDEITKAVGKMLAHTQAELEHHMDEQEDRDIIAKGQTVQEFFRYDVVPYAKTYPITDANADVNSKISDLLLLAREVIVKMRALIKARAEKGNGGAIMVLYRNLHAVVQCMLTAKRWRYGLTQEVINDTEREMTSLIEIWVPVVQGLQRMSDNSFSPGIVRFHAGEAPRPQFTKYSYYYLGKAQPGAGPNLAPVAQAFIEARQAGRSNAIPQDLYEWNKKPYEILQQLEALKGQAAPQPTGSAPFDSRSWYKIKTTTKPGMALDVVNDGNQERDGRLQMAPEGNFSGQHWQLRPSKTSPGFYNLCTMWLGTKMCLDVYGDDKTRPHLAAAGNFTGQQWHVESQAIGTWRLSNSYSGTLIFAADENGNELHLRDPQASPASQWNLELVRPITESGFDL